MPELCTANTGDIAVVFGFVIILKISHVGMRYFGRLFELCCASPVYAPERQIFVFCEVIRQSIGEWGKQLKKQKRQRQMGTHPLKGARKMIYIDMLWHFMF